MLLVRVVALLVACVSVSLAVRILSRPPLRCSRQDLRCTASASNCIDTSWLKSYNYTPSGPEDLQVSMHTQKDETGHLQPVLIANWKLKDDGSIFNLKATELHILVISTNQNLCVRYSFKDSLQMRSPSKEQWSFSADMVVVEPGQMYRVSVFNIPKPEEGHSGYDVSKVFSVPDCQDPNMQMTQFCIERGSLWQPNISVTLITAVKDKHELAVNFSTDTLCDEYIVIVSCSAATHVAHTYKGNQTTLDATFSLGKWPRSCCLFDVEIKPIFRQCGHDCARRRTTLNICHEEPTDTPDVHSYTYTFVAFGILFFCVATAATIFVCRKSDKGNHKWVETKNPQPYIKEPPTVLVIYSQDHHLYRDVVLKLCAFLQAKCGTKVLADLLDSTLLGMVGRVRWLEWQRRQLKNPCDKILVLCSPGVQAKWKAMCGQGRVTLREDLLSPTDDMLTPFLNLFLPDMHQAGMLGKYMVAYFDDICSERDVPSVFDIAVKYKLMKHFEELYFRILDIDKYQPGQINHIEGVGGEEYFNCPSGEALKNAIEVFQAYQLENPDWFEKECVNSEEDVCTEANLLIGQLQIQPVLECVPLVRDNLPIYAHEVEIAENNSVHVLTPEMNPERQLLSVIEMIPVNPELKHQYPSNLDQVLTDHVFPSPECLFLTEPVLWQPPTPKQNELLGQIPIEDNEEDSLLPSSQLATHSDLRSPTLQSSPPESSHTGIQREYFLPLKTSHFQPVEMVKAEVLETSGKGPSSGSDQGYISKMSSQHEPLLKEDPLVALARLQEELFQQNL